MVNITNIYNKALQAIDKRQFEYALEMLIQCVSLDPDNVEARKKLRATTRHIKKESGGNATKARIKGFGGWMMQKVSQTLKKDPDKAMIDIEKSLVGDPDNVDFLLIPLGDAAMAAQHLNAAIWIYEDAAALAPQNVQVLEKLAYAYELNGNIKTAQEICGRILKLQPNHGPALRKAKDLAAKETMSKGWEKAGEKGGFREMVKDNEAQEDLEIKDKILRTDGEVQDAIEMTQRQILEDPKSTRLMMKLGDLFKRVKRWDDAKAIYDRAAVIDKADFTILYKQGQLILDRLIEESEVAKAEYQAAPANTALKNQYLGLIQQLNKIKLDEYTKRVKAQPTNGAFQFDLGEHQIRLKQYREAIGAFQKVAHDPEYRLRALNYLGQAFMALENYDLSEKQFLAALENARIVNDRVKPLIYNLGRLYVKMGRKQEAIQQLNRIYEVDINFKDVADQLNELKKG